MHTDSETNLLSFTWQAFVILALVVANGLFVAAEFALVKVRNSQLRPLLQKGDWRARIAMRAMKDLDASLSACQLGITLASIGLGWLGEKYVVHWLAPVFQLLDIRNLEARDSIAFAIAYLSVTFVHITLGEQGPKMYAIQRPRRVTLWVAPMVTVFHAIFRPFIWVLNAASNLLLKLAGLNPIVGGEHQPFSHEELQHLLLHSTHAHPGDELVNSILLKALRLKETTAEQIMVPAHKVALLWKNRTLADNLALAQKCGYSRMPLAGDAPDTVLGIVHIKELLWQVQVLAGQTKIEHIMRPALTFLPNTKLPTMLELFRQSRNHLAVVVDREDRMIGIVSFEDVLEELVGDIRDEFDVEKGPIFERTENSLLVDADLPVRDVALEMDWPLPLDTTETVEKWALRQWQRIPDKGESLEIEGVEVVAEEISKRGLRRVRLTRNGAERERLPPPETTIRPL
ncbi:MAG: HlyC/CorC family transporter [Verrucomicrobiae bacterium]|nr:HlyC/CorC family transporter [Verrucomicrobiae bacterium]